MNKVFPRTFDRPFQQFGQATIFWLLVSGFWRDEGHWVDGAYWNDGV